MCRNDRHSSRAVLLGIPEVDSPVVRHMIVGRDIQIVEDQAVVYCIVTVGVVADSHRTELVAVEVDHRLVVVEVGHKVLVVIVGDIVLAVHIVLDQASFQLEEACPAGRPWRISSLLRRVMRVLRNVVLRLYA